jgi:hypothetical protein
MGASFFPHKNLQVQQENDKKKTTVADSVPRPTPSQELKMPRPAPPRRAIAPAQPVASAQPAAPPAKPSLDGHRINSFLYHLGLSGSVSFAATRSGLDRRALYRRRDDDEAFAARWDEALNLGVERLQDDAMRRALEGTPRPVWRNGKQVGSVRQFDNGLLRFLLKAHRPETYSDRAKAGGASPLPFDLAQRLAAAATRADAHDNARKNQTEQPHARRPKQKR